jgi:hypothetical protein
VQRRQRYEAAERGEQCGIDARRRRVIRAAVDQAMTDRGGALGKLVEHAAHGGRHVADVVDRTADGGAIAGEHGVLQRRRPRVEREDRRHGVQVQSRISGRSSKWLAM